MKAMKVINTYVVLDKNPDENPKIIFECEGNKWYVNTNGAIGRRHTYWERITIREAKKLIKTP